MENYLYIRCMMNPLDNVKPEFLKVIEHLEKELKNMRSGRANSAVVEDVRVEAYGQMMELKGMAAISVPDAKTIQIEPWDKSVVKDIEKALIAANLGMSPNVSGTVIRLNVPQMTEETRRDAVKIISQKGEHARVGIRSVREAIRSAIEKQEKEKLISEDEKFRLNEQLDKITKEQNDKIGVIVKDKEEEMMTV